ncbi:MAG: radical SAM protein [Lachnospiraceae bacterium]|nr:radical SAM protein [Lachnospiraceae bacterium]
MDMSLYENCRLCPRNCGVNRTKDMSGYCGQPAAITAARAALHPWEEPVISGTGGSGTIFFSGCNLKCIFCQNRSIALGQTGRQISTERLAEICLELQTKGAHNINLVTAGHFIPHIIKALEAARLQGLSIPIVYNTGSYEYADTLRMLEGLVDIYLPDLKYYSSALSSSFSNAPDYFSVATVAISEMFRQVGAPRLNEDTGLLEKGLIVRHLLLPGQTKDSKKILRYLHETYGDQIYISIMNQYTPLKQVADHPILSCQVTSAEYERVLDFADRIGIRLGFFQEGGTVSESFIPAFDGEGL